MHMYVYRTPFKESIQNPDCLLVPHVLSMFRRSGCILSLPQNCCQLMNHFIESPEIVMFEGSEVGRMIVTGEVKRSSLNDRGW